MRTAYVAYCFFRDALHRITGIEREASLATTLFATGILASVFAQITAPIFRAMRTGRPKPPSLLNCAAGLVAVRAGARRIGGEQVQGPVADAIIASSLLAPALTLITFPLTITRVFLASLARAWRYATGAAAAPSRQAAQ